ncbi:MAG: DUF3499 family protein [Leucobacter sp.]
MSDESETAGATADEGADHGAASEDRTGMRLCARVACGSPAVATLTADYENRVMAVGPLSPEPVFQAHDLCERHTARLSPMSGWSIVRHSTHE